MKHDPDAMKPERVFNFPALPQNRVLKGLGMIIPRVIEAIKSDDKLGFCAQTLRIGQIEFRIIWETSEWVEVYQGRSDHTLWFHKTHRIFYNSKSTDDPHVKIDETEIMNMTVPKVKPVVPVVDDRPFGPIEDGDLFGKPVKPGKNYEVRWPNGVVEKKKLIEDDGEFFVAHEINGLRIELSAADFEFRRVKKSA